jgi:hypothetical protein
MPPSRRKILAAIAALPVAASLSPAAAPGPAPLVLAALPVTSAMTFTRTSGGWMFGAVTLRDGVMKTYMRNEAGQEWSTVSEVG